MRLIFLRGKLKGLFFFLHGHRFLPSHLFSFFGSLSALSKWIQNHKKIGFNDFYSFAFRYEKREELFEHVITQEGLDAPIDYLEFGVSKGDSFRWWTARIKHPDARFYGFDTFTGLPEDWGPFKKGDMSSGESLPEINDSRFAFYQGLFQQTLLPFLSEFDASRKKVIHMDADLYTATLYVLTLITPYLREGDVLFFDEFNVPQHEFKAFTEWISAFYIEYEVLGAVNNYYQIAVKITKA
ncbi:MAG: class I SAM-dependent methyltransferase [Flavobacteriales bacterium]